MSTRHYYVSECDGWHTVPTHKHSHSRHHSHGHGHKTRRSVSSSRSRSRSPGSTRDCRHRRRHHHHHHHSHSHSHAHSGSRRRTRDHEREGDHGKNAMVYLDLPAGRALALSRRTLLVELPVSVWPGLSVSQAQAQARAQAQAQAQSQILAHSQSLVPTQMHMQLPAGPPGVMYPHSTSIAMAPGPTLTHSIQRLASADTAGMALLPSSTMDAPYLAGPDMPLAIAPGSAAPRQSISTPFASTYGQASTTPNFRDPFAVPTHTPMPTAAQPFGMAAHQRASLHQHQQHAALQPQLAAPLLEQAPEYGDEAASPHQVPRHRASVHSRAASMATLFGPSDAHASRRHSSTPAAALVPDDVVIHDPRATAAVSPAAATSHHRASSVLSARRMSVQPSTWNAVARRSSRLAYLDTSDDDVIDDDPNAFDATVGGLGLGLGLDPDDAARGTRARPLSVGSGIAVRSQGVYPGGRRSSAGQSPLRAASACDLRYSPRSMPHVLGGGRDGRYGRRGSSAGGALYDDPLPRTRTRARARARAHTPADPRRRWSRGAERSPPRQSVRYVDAAAQQHYRTSRTHEPGEAYRRWWRGAGAGAGGRSAWATREARHGRGCECRECRGGRDDEHEYEYFDGGLEDSGESYYGSDSEAHAVGEEKRARRHVRY